MYVDNDGWLVNEAGDTAKIIKLPRATNYGPLRTTSGKPIIFVHHCTATLAPLGADVSDRDGTAGMAKRVANGTAKYYAHVYLGRDGQAYQMVPFTRAAISVEGSFKFDVPPEAKGKENNRIAASMEWTGWGGTKDQAKKDLTGRADMKLVGKWFWQIPTLTQAKAAGEITKAVVKWSDMDPEAAFYGHKQIGSGAHADPGPVILGALDVIGRPMLGLMPRLAENLFPFASMAVRVGIVASVAAAKTASQAVTVLGKSVASLRRNPVQTAVAGVAGSWLGYLFVQGLRGRR